MEAHNEAHRNHDATASGPLLGGPDGDVVNRSRNESSRESSSPKKSSTEPNVREMGPGQDSFNANNSSRKPPRRRYRIFWYWKLELTALAISFGLVAAMFALLLSYNKQKVPEWAFSINLSTLLDVLAQLFSAAMGSIVAQVISQEKWAWFSVPEKGARPLRNLQDFDQGSRDALGAARLIPKVLRRSPTAAVAALVTISLLAVGPFVQQAVQTESCSYVLSGTNATIPYAHYVPRQALVFDEGRTKLTGSSSLELQNAVYSSLLGGDSASENLISPNCITGNCTFPSGDPVQISNDTLADTNSTDFGGVSDSFSTSAVCSSCIETTSLANYSSGDASTTFDYTLPNGQNISYEGYGIFVRVATDYDISWAGDLLTPAHAEAARWAMVNVTFLAFSVAQCGNTVTDECPIPGKTTLGGVDESSIPNKTAGPIAATCALYPCMRSYVPSVTNNKLSEIQIGTSKVWPSKSLNDEFATMEEKNSMLNTLSHYAGVQSPCRVGDAIYTTQNMSTAPNTTMLQLYEVTTEDTAAGSRNVSAPEQCIYRQNAGFISEISGIFNDDTMFNTQCQNDPRIGPDCAGAETDGMNEWLDTLYNSGNATVSAVDAFFESFASALTNRYRSNFGTSEFLIDNEAYQGQTLPLGEVQGLVWKDTVCTAAKWEWLLLPAVLLFLTSCLLAMTLARAWKNRHVQPVWKANVLPSLLYKERFKDNDGPTSTWSQGITGADVTERSSSDTNDRLGRLMEIDEINRVTKKVMVRFELEDVDQRTTQVTEMQQGWI